ncbi:hypothetical protein GFO_0007 [Christiangramia forsetii KT0803]|uniref:Uncharacterized protein n=1 Tax=Christiangramia forsetii (strain DSM 17595 / CGMCC 1.15422 / KT0803) TaxID=411154 RepID=A0LXA3_CHRFK|nr:hypothetical protein GFO_0007 [Christiangramia forsetii KT0803]
MSKTLPYILRIPQMILIMLRNSEFFIKLFIGRRLEGIQNNFENVIVLKMIL